MPEARSLKPEARFPDPARDPDPDPDPAPTAATPQALPDVGGSPPASLGQAPLPEAPPPATGRPRRWLLHAGAAVAAVAAVAGGIAATRGSGAPDPASGAGGAIADVTGAPAGDATGVASDGADAGALLAAIGDPVGGGAADGDPADGDPADGDPADGDPADGDPAEDPADRDEGTAPAGPDGPVRVRDGSRRASLATLVVESDPAGEVVIDGVRRGAGARVPVRLAPGRHKLQVRGVGWNVRRSVTLAPGQTRTESVRPPLGRLVIKVKPWARVKLDGVDIGATPLPARDVPAGRHLLVLTNPNLAADRTMFVDVSPGEERVVKVILDE